LSFLLFPLWVFALYPNILNLIAPTILINRMTDKMFYGTFVLTLSVLITIPLLYTMTFVLTWFFTNVWVALIHLASLPLLVLFANYYLRFLEKTKQALRFRIHFKTNKMNDLRRLRDGIHQRLNELLMNETT